MFSEYVLNSQVFKFKDISKLFSRGKLVCDAFKSWSRCVVTNNPNPRPRVLGTFKGSNY